MSSVLAHTLKVSSRAAHLMSMALFFSATFTDFLTGAESNEGLHPSLRFAFKWSGIVILVTGLINMVFIIKTKKWVRNRAFSIWKYTLMAKFAVTVALSPLLGKIVSLFVSSPSYSLLQKLRFYVCIVTIVSTSALRYFRETNFKVEEKKKE